MRRLIPVRSFNRWTPAVRFLGLGVCIVGLVQVLASEPAGIVVAVIGAIVWQTGALLEWWSSGFQHFSRIRVSDVMRTERIDVPAWWKIAKLATKFPDSNPRSFFVALQDGYELGILLPEQFRNISEDEARYLPVGQMSRSIGYIDSVLDDDSLLGVYAEVRRRNRNWVTVLDRRGHIVGVVTREDLQQVLEREQGLTTHEPPATDEPGVRNAA